MGLEDWHAVSGLKVLIDASEALTVPAPSLAALRSVQAQHRLGGLAGDQRAAVEAICTSAGTLDVLVGPAGSGKTTTLAALARQWEATDGPGTVTGLAPSASAAHTLSRSIGVPCETTAKWLHETVGDGAAQRVRRHDRLTRDMPTEPDPRRREAMREVSGA